MTLEVNSAGGVRLHGSALKKSKRSLPGTTISAAHISVFPRIHSLLRAAGNEEAKSVDLLVHHSGHATRISQAGCGASNSSLVTSRPICRLGSSSNGRRIFTVAGDWP
jgi:hypothetical protein